MIRLDDLASEALTKLTQRVRVECCRGRGDSRIRHRSSLSSQVARTYASRRGEARMRLNAWLARAGVASRRGSDELIKAGRVTVNGAPGQLNTVVADGDDVRLDGRPLAAQALAYVLLHKPAGVITTAQRPAGPADGRQPRQAPGAGRPGRAARRRDDRRPAADERRRARTHRSRTRSTRSRRSTSPSSTRVPATRRSRSSLTGVLLDDGPTAPARGAAARAHEARADDPRGPKPPGAAHARGGRPPRQEPAPQPLRPADARRARARRVARARALRGGAVAVAYEAAARAAAASSSP